MKVFFTLPFLLIYGLLLTAWLARSGRVRLAAAVSGTMAVGLYLLCTSALTHGLMHLTGEFAPENNPQTLQARGAQARVV